MNRFISLAMVLSFLACSSKSTKLNSGQESQTMTRLATPGLTKEHAQWRAGQVSDVKYDLSFSLDDKEKDFTGVARISFNLKNTTTLTLDFTEGKIASLEINGKKQEPVEYKDFFISLKADLLKRGENIVVVHFSHPYNTSGVGLHRTKDPEDGLTYLYTQFEPYDANKVFPSFDQPDLKAKFTLKVEAPKTWTVVSAAREDKVTPAGQDRRLWNFPEVGPFSTYLISLHAGPYKMWASKAGKIPLRLFARQSLAKYIDANDWLTDTREGLEFYQKYFGYAYPFKKYDQLIVPDFNAGAMENVAAVAFSERFVKRGKPTLDDREDTASVLLHEMAHMWFGDLVTMKWWNGLWLNESFATFMSALAVQEATPYKKSWHAFFVKEKEWAYNADQLVTTHPIELAVGDTESAFSNFDAITYGKGASVLKQLNYLVGPTKFRNGVRNYFKKFAFQNAELKDFIGAVAESSDVNLDKWKAQWLEEAGLNTIEAQFLCEHGKVSSFKLLQTPSGQGLSTFRTHRTEVALLKKDEAGNFIVEKVQPVTYSEAQTPVPALVGETCPEMVFTNLNDYDYVKPKLDAVTLKNAENLTNIQDSFVRTMMWATLWDMVRDGLLPIQTYADLIIKNLDKESEFKIVDSVLNTVYGYREYQPSVLSYLPIENEDAKVFKKNYTARLEQFLWNHFNSSKPGSDFQKRWFDAYVRTSATPDAEQKLSALVEGKVKAPGFILDQDRRWNVVIRLNELGVSTGSELLQKEAKKDLSQAGQTMAQVAEASRPSRELKKQWFDKILSKDESIAFAQKRETMRRLFPSDQRQLLNEFSQSFFDKLSWVSSEMTSDFQKAFAETLAPTSCTQESVARWNEYLSADRKLTPTILKTLKVARQEDERCLIIRQVAKRGPAGL